MPKNIVRPEKTIIWCKCMKCGKKFLSFSMREHLCRKCRKIYIVY